MLTTEEFLSHPAARERSELVRGALRVMTPTGGAHGVVCGNVFELLSSHARTHGLGRCFTDGTGFALPGLERTVRSPDVAFVLASRLPAGGIGRGFMTVAPDLAVEVVSPSEREPELEEKIEDYLASGVSMIWVIDFELRLVTVITRDARRVLRASDALHGEVVFPGFSCSVSTLFEGLAPP